MTKIDFHILPTADRAETLNYVCRLALKALSLEHRVLIAVEHSEHRDQLSSALWHFQPDSFLAHNNINEPHYPLQISDTDECGEHHDVLINLCSDIPEYFSRFERVFEVVNQQSEFLEASRKRYRFYNDRGYDIQRNDRRQRSAQ